MGKIKQTVRDVKNLAKNTLRAAKDTAWDALQTPKRMVNAVNQGVNNGITRGAKRAADHAGSVPFASALGGVVGTITGFADGVVGGIKEGINFLNRTTDRASSLRDEAKAIWKGIFNDPQWWNNPLANYPSYLAANPNRPTDPASLKFMTNEALTGGVWPVSKIAVKCYGITNSDRDVEEFNLQSFKAFQTIRQGLRSNLPYTIDQFREYLRVTYDLLPVVFQIARAIRWYNYTDPNIPYFRDVLLDVAETNRAFTFDDLQPGPVYNDENLNYTMSRLPVLAEVLKQLVVPAHFYDLHKWMFDTMFTDGDGYSKEIYILEPKSVEWPGFSIEDGTTTVSYQYVDGTQLTIDNIIDTAQSALTKYGIMLADIKRLDGYKPIDINNIYERDVVFVQDHEMLDAIDNAYTHASLAEYHNPEWFRLDFSKEVTERGAELGTLIFINTEEAGQKDAMFGIIGQRVYANLNGLIAPGAGKGTYSTSGYANSVAFGENTDGINVKSIFLTGSADGNFEANVLSGNDFNSAAGSVGGNVNLNSDAVVTSSTLFLGEGNTYRTISGYVTPSGTVGMVYRMQDRIWDAVVYYDFVHDKIVFKDYNLEFELSNGTALYNPVFNAVTFYNNPQINTGTTGLFVQGQKPVYGVETGSEAMHCEMVYQVAVPEAVAITDNYAAWNASLLFASMSHCIPISVRTWRYIRLNGEIKTFSGTVGSLLKKSKRAVVATAQELQTTFNQMKYNILFAIDTLRKRDRKS